MANEKKYKYSDDYKERYEAYLAKKRKERENSKEKPKITLVAEAKEPIKPNQGQNIKLTESEKIIEEIKQKIEKEEHKAWQYFTEPKHIKIMKEVAILIALLILAYLSYSNFIASQDFNYFYDLGSSLDAKKPYLTPLVRVSDISNDSNVSYRNLLSGLVYFSVNIPRGSETITIQARFRDNFPNKSKMSIGASDNLSAWHYKYNNIYTSKGGLTKAWVINSTSFNLKTDKLAVKNSQLSLLFNNPHLNKNETLNYTIPVDWINITIHKPGLLEKLKK